MEKEQYAIVGRVVDVIKGVTIDQGVVVTEGNRIIGVGAVSNVVVPSGAAVIRAPEKGTILPGFIDCHGHLAGTSDDTWFNVRREDALLRGVRDVRQLLDSGFTTIREMSIYGAPLRRAIEKGYFVGPRIITGGQVLSVTAGHGDTDTGLPLEYAKDNPLCLLVDGVDECVKGVRKQFRNGADFIKVCATGGVSSQSDGLDDVQFSDEELRAIVAEAKRHGSYVAAHCIGTAGTLQALHAGVETVEHGCMLDEECVTWMATHGVSLVTTLSIAMNVAKSMRVPEWMRRKSAGVMQKTVQAFSMAKAAGINIALGTDYTNTKNSPFAHIGNEFLAIAECGFSNMEALQIGTINAARAIRMDEEVGSLEIGKFADIVISSDDATQDLKAVSTCDGICFTMKDGKVIKNTI